MTVAYLYKSGKLIEVPDGFIHHDILSRDFGISRMEDAIEAGFVRIRVSFDGYVAFQARSRDLLCSAARLLLRTGSHIITKVGVEFPGRFYEMSLIEFDEWL